MSIPDTKIEIGRLFMELSKLLKNNVRKNFEETGITMPQSIVIGTLMKFGEMKISELSKRINLSNSTISGIVDRLEKQQLVERRRSEEDRRIVYVKVAPKFDEIHRESHKKLEKCFDDILSTGSPEEIKKIIEGLNALKKILIEYNSEESH